MIKNRLPEAAPGTQTLTITDQLRIPADVAFYFALLRLQPRCPAPMAADLRKWLDGRLSRGAGKSGLHVSVAFRAIPNLSSIQTKGVSN